MLAEIRAKQYSAQLAFHPVYCRTLAAILRGSAEYVVSRSSNANSTENVRDRLCRLLITALEQLGAAPSYWALY
jgi:hypothetical protein